MEDEDSPRDLLDDLMHLPEAGRERYMKRLSRVSLHRILSLALGDADGLKQIDKAPDVVEAPSGEVPTLRSTEQTTDTAQSETTESISERKSLKRRLSSSVHPIDTATKRSSAFETSFPPPEIQDPESIPETLPMGPKITPKLEDDQENERVRKSVANYDMGPALPFTISLPTPYGSIVKDMQSLPSNVRFVLENRFRAICWSNAGRIENFRALRENPRRYLRKDTCIWFYLTNNTNRAKRGGYYPNVGKPQINADDLCVKGKRPCAYVIDHNGRPSISFVSLPAQLRAGKNWCELEYWVLPGDYEP